MADLAGAEPLSGSLVELAARLDRVESELAIHRLAHEYCHGVDRRDVARFAAVWHPDATWEVSADERFVGLEEILGAVAQQWESFAEMHHHTANHVVTVTRDYATGEADVDVTVRLLDGSWLRGGGSYADTYERRHGVWRIARREVLTSFVLEAPPAGP